MKFWALVFLAILLPVVSAGNISVNYNEQAEVNKEFPLKIGLTNFPEDIYDVKIDADVGGSNVAKILNNGEWKSTYYYINDIISNNEEKEFTLKVESYIGKINITVKIRSSSGSSENFPEYEIEILQSSDSSSQNSSSSEILDDNTQQNNETDNTNNSTSSQNTNSNSIKATARIVENAQNQTVSNIIKLNENANSQNIKSENSFKNLYGNWAMISLVVFSMIILSLLLLKNKTKKNELV